MNSIALKTVVGCLAMTATLAGCSSTSSEPQASPTPTDFCAAYVTFEVNSIQIALDYEAAGGEKSADYAQFQQRLIDSYTTMQATVPTTAPATVQLVFADSLKSLQNENYKSTVQPEQQQELVSWVQQSCPNIEQELTAKKQALISQAPTPTPAKS